MAKYCVAKYEKTKDFSTFAYHKLDENTMRACDELPIALLKSEVVPALGCTEPIAVALAVANARELLDAPVERVEVKTSANIYKNGMGVGIPGTGRTGLLIAAALGAVEGKASDELELLKHVNDASVDRALKLMEKNAVQVSVAEGVEKLFVLATVYDAKGETASCTISGSHTHVASRMKNGYEIENRGCGATQNIQTCVQEAKTVDGKAITIAEIYQFITTVAIDDIKFILEAERLNRRIAEEGLRKDYGLCVGRRIWERIQKGKLGDDLLTRAMAMTAAASDARMAGSTIPVMSNSGSGNQGITATVPVLAAADILGVDEEKLARALALSHLVAIHIKGYLGRLSALCGCVVASSGAGCGVAYLLGGGEKEIEATIKNMLGNMTGMLCDGAKVGCALKVSSGVSAAITSALLAIDGECISSNDGIIEESVEQTIANVGRIGAEGMLETDKMVLDIMTHKQCD